MQLVNERFRLLLNSQMPLCHDCYEYGGKQGLGVMAWAGMDSKHILRPRSNGLPSTRTICGIEIGGAKARIKPLLKR